MQQLKLLILTRAADDRRWRPGGFDNPRIIRACLYHSVSRSGARVADSRGGLCVSRDRERNAALLRPSIRDEGLSDEERIRAPLALSLSLSLVSVKVFQSPTAARARVLSLSRPRKDSEEQQRRQKQDLQER